MMSTVLQLQLSSGARLLRGHQHIWDVIMAAGRNNAVFTLTAIEGETNANRATVRDYVNRLVKASYVAEVRAGSDRAPARQFRVIKRAKQAPRLRRDGTECGTTGQQGMWNILRGPMARGGVDASKLRELCLLTDIPVTEATANSYLQRLCRAGYLAIVQPAVRRKRKAVYRLLPTKDTGPQAPLILATKLVYDRNSHSVMGLSDVHEVTS